MPFLAIIGVVLVVLAICGLLDVIALPIIAVILLFVVGIAWWPTAATATWAPDADQTPTNGRGG